MDNEINVVVLAASSLYEEKKYDELVEYCEEEILKHPNSLYSGPQNPDSNIRWCLSWKGRPKWVKKSAQ